MRRLLHFAGWACVVHLLIHEVPLALVLLWALLR